MSTAALTPKQRRAGAPLMRMLEEKLLSCLDNNGELNLALIARRIGMTRQAIHQNLNREMLSPQVSYLLLEEFPSELEIRDIKPFVMRPK